MDAQFEYDVFLSYHPDYKRSLVDDLYHFLVSNGLIVWKKDERELLNLSLMIDITL